MLLARDLKFTTVNVILISIILHCLHVAQSVQSAVNVIYNNSISNNNSNDDSSGNETIVVMDTMSAVQLNHSPAGSTGKV